MPDQRSYLWLCRPCSVPISVTLSLDIPRGVWLRKPEEGDKLKWSRFPETRITSSRWRWLGRCPVPMLWIVAVKGRVLWSSSTNQMPRLSPLLQWAAITGCSLVGVWPEAGRGMLGMFPTPAAPPPSVKHYHSQFIKEGLKLKVKQKIKDESLSYGSDDGDSKIEGVSFNYFLISGHFSISRTWPTKMRRGGVGGGNETKLRRRNAETRRKRERPDSLRRGRSWKYKMRV